MVIGGLIQNSISWKRLIVKVGKSLGVAVDGSGFQKNRHVPISWKEHLMHQLMFCSKTGKNFGVVIEESVLQRNLPIYWKECACTRKRYVVNGYEFCLCIGGFGYRSLFLGNA